MANAHGNPREQSLLSFKVVFLGASGVGKSSICHYFIKGEYSDDLASTVGATFHLQKMQVGDVQVKLKIWDTAGQERFRSLLPMYYKGCHGAFIVYDITSRESFEAARSYLHLLRNQSQDAEILLIANKSDLSHMRTVPISEGNLLASNEGIFCLETSAKTGQHVTEAIQKLAEKIYQKHHEGTTPKRLDLEKPQNTGNDDEKSSCKC